MTELDIDRNLIRRDTSVWRYIAAIGGIKHEMELLYGSKSVGVNLAVGSLFSALGKLYVETNSGRQPNVVFP